MIRRLFIANRGEIALRVARTAQRLGMTAILGASQGDAASLPAMLADEVALVGPAPSAQSYLDVDAVIAAAMAARADAIHPGYGFLSENARFAKAAADAGIIFVGPDISSLEAMGDKLMARAVGQAAGLPVVPGGEASTPEEALARARETGFPVLLKAVAGGGGKGMKRVEREEDLIPMIAMAMAEAQASFGDPRVYVERFIASGRHVEVQVLGDGESAIHLGTRDCSIQRRFQKLVEEAPAPMLPDATRSGLERAAVALAKSLHYKGAGTVEFLVDAKTGDFYFLEMNARIQVEHPVTEAITGVDLVEQQLLVAGGARLSLDQDAIRPRGHAIEVRINAEDPEADFRPSPGTVTRAAWPAGPGIRVDSHIASGGMIPPFYDSLMGKLIVWGEDRPAAVARLACALDTLSIEGVASTTSLHRRIAADPRFIAGGVDTRFLEGL
ncbi:MULTISPECIES: acetyl-CoA carboxylase biotin carboxylase subunit [unclassified Novosphingobium]|uniref:acetyl-CoA carboxylase biotin carboxylase subunit n=1 Tax=unclassified Novosphingobium TaxID=2644732 RepID=UPI000AF3C0AA|nr:MULTISPECIES: biotin carboxylase N-terminal domain-containing protein [unclassified Novosphingobium]MBN9144297.1 ATP-grasp domain-containing protein [Novosphingobium sp.]MDR6707619.1 acetyl-CoA carboxylase biotin carboxylase subunit [Novosphingobium sp. 1748]